MSAITVPGDRDRLAGCCAQPDPKTGRPRVTLWVGDTREGKLLPVDLEPGHALALGRAISEGAASLIKEPVFDPATAFDPSQIVVHPPEEEA